MNRLKPTLSFRHIARGAQVGLPVGVAIGISSYRYTGSSSHAYLTALALASVATLVQAFRERRIEGHLRSKGIDLPEVPIRPMFRLKCALTPEQAVSTSTVALNDLQLKVRKFLIQQPTRLVVVTGWSRDSWGERISIESRAVSGVVCQLEATSVPIVPTIRLDSGVNFTNLFEFRRSLGKHVPPEALFEEKWVDTETGKTLAIPPCVESRSAAAS